MSSIQTGKAPSPSSSDLARAPPTSKRTPIRKALSPGSPGSSLDMAVGTATTNHPDPRPWQRDGSASSQHSPASSSQPITNFRESRSPQGGEELEAMCGV